MPHCPTSYFTNLQFSLRFMGGSDKKHPVARGGYWGTCHLTSGSTLDMLQLEPVCNEQIQKNKDLKTYLPWVCALVGLREGLVSCRRLWCLIAWLSERKRSFLATWTMDLHEPVTGFHQHEKDPSTGKQSKNKLEIANDLMKKSSLQRKIIVG